MDSKSWIRTDDLQFVLKKSAAEFDVIDIVEVPNGEFYASYRKIDLEDEEDGDIANVIKSYGYKTIEGLKELYGDGANRIIAECLAEQMQFDEDTAIIRNESAINDWLQEVGCNLTI